MELADIEPTFTSWIHYLFSKYFPLFFLFLFFATILWNSPLSFAYIQAIVFDVCDLEDSDDLIMIMITLEQVSNQCTSFFLIEEIILLKTKFNQINRNACTFRQQCIIYWWSCLCSAIICDTCSIWFGGVSVRFS